ncbi:MAG: peptidoglycan bridge formation glycyltransferase FemA/FemB family protein [Patescibacteria group bacterium]|nr:peptidoglycan bridge formation glycyltransferase FemA/FemB family protein [Patescibacteria group bacterium]
MIISKPILKKSIWEKFLQSSDQVNFLQSWNWGKFHLSLGHSIIRLGFYKSKKLIGVALLIKIKAKRGSYLECPGGPVIPWQNKSVVKRVFKDLKNQAVKESVSFIRIRPNIKVGLVDLKALGLIKSPMHLHAESTWMLKLNLSTQELLANMRKNTRSAIKKAKKLNLKVTSSTNHKDIDTLFKLQLETVKRKKFTPFNKEYFSKQFKAFNPDHQIQIFKASYKGRVLAISFIIFYGNQAVYHYSGSSSKYRHIPASYALQWAIIKQAKKKQFPYYNFWGYTNNPHHRFYGPSLFKKGFGGFELNYQPAHDLPLKPSYWLIYIFETLRRRIRHL